MGTKKGTFQCEKRLIQVLIKIIVFPYQNIMATPVARLQLVVRQRLHEFDYVDQSMLSCVLVKLSKN